MNIDIVGLKKYFTVVLFICIFCLFDFSYSGTKEISGSYIKCPDEHDFYESGASNQQLDFIIYIDSEDLEYGDYVSMTFPSGFTINSAEDMSYEYYNGASGNTATWGDNDNDYGGISPGITHHFSVNVDISSSVTGNKTISYYISGDETGATPHYVNGSFTIRQGLPDLVIESITATNQFVSCVEFNTITITVKNQGDITAEDFIVEIYYDRDSPPTQSNVGDDSQDIYTLGSGSSADVDFTVFSGLPGYWNVYAWVDRSNAVDESNNNNNKGGPYEIGWYHMPISNEYRWPFEDYDVARNINSVIDEYRKEGTRIYFHDGIDIQTNENTEVYSVSSGLISRNSTWVRVGNFYYDHLKNLNPILENGKWVLIANYYLAETNYRNHLHFSDGQNHEEINSLRLNGINPSYQDYYDPIIPDDGLIIRKHGTTQELELNKIKLKIDIIVKVKDHTWTESNRNGLYKLSFNITGQGKDYSVDSYQFDKWLEDTYANLVYPIAPENNPNYIFYQITNYMTDDQTVISRYWDTKDDGSGGFYPNGQYTLTVIANDFSGRTFSREFTIEVANSAEH
ncbi:MAG: hypothetical protein ISS81_04985 [Candidatus Marinimicrobia bacterium]|nr:hypothetical protein [Candidatus Neomarinimicrobiota bacterium]